MTCDLSMTFMLQLIMFFNDQIKKRLMVNNQLNHWVVFVW